MGPLTHAYLAKIASATPDAPGNPFGSARPSATARFPSQNPNDETEAPATLLQRREEVVQGQVFLRQMQRLRAHLASAPARKEQRRLDRERQAVEASLSPQQRDCLSELLRTGQRAEAIILVEAATLRALGPAAAVASILRRRSRQPDTLVKLKGRSAT